MVHGYTEAFARILNQRGIEPVLRMLLPHDLMRTPWKADGSARENVRGDRALELSTAKGEDSRGLSEGAIRGGPAPGGALPMLRPDRVR